MNTFNNTIATKLINTSIRSAIFIDEKLALPYSDETDESGICRDLYANFQERGCSLSFHKFISSDIIAKDKIKCKPPVKYVFSATSSTCIFVPKNETYDDTRRSCRNYYVLQGTQSNL